MAPMKRKGTFAKRSNAKRSRHSSLVPTVVNALADAECLPSNLRALLKQTLPIVLNANKVDRHAYENEVVDQAQQALGAVEKAIQQEHAAALAAQNAVIAPKERTSRTKAKNDAEAHLEAVKAKMEGNKAAKKAAEKAEQDAEHGLKAAQHEAKVADRDFQKVVDKSDGLKHALATEFVMLKEGTSASAAGKKAVQKLLALGKEYGLDSTLLQTFPITCKKPAATRTEFEAMMFTSLQALIDGQIQVLAQKIAEALPVKNAKADAVAAADNARGQAQAVLTAASEELSGTQTAHKDGAKKVAKADAHLRHLWEDMRHACDQQDSLVNDLNSFKHNIWVAFQQLKEKEPEPEPVEEPEPVAEVPAQDGSDLVPAAEAAVLPVAAP